MEILRTENLCKTYGSGETKVEALKNANISINEGEFVAVVGPRAQVKVPCSTF